VELQAGRARGAGLDRVRWYPHDLRLPAGKFVTIKITNPSTSAHSLAVESLDCETEPIGRGKTVMVSFRVPAGETTSCAPFTLLL
jgi:hypothetical protein